MEKVVLTTYRKLYRMCRRVDASVAMRTQLVCCPLQVYDHRMMEWQSFDLAQMDWAESRSYLDALIRRLNNGSPQYIPPLPEEVTKAVEDYNVQCAFMFAEEERSRSAAAAAAATTTTTTDGTTADSQGGERTAVDAKEEEGSNGAFTTSTTTSSDGASGSGRGAAIPLNVLPYSSLVVALRLIYAETPFSLGNVANGFAAVKELQYVCDLDDAGRPHLITLSATPTEGAAPFTAASDVPHLQRAVAVAPLHNSLINGLSAEQRVSLDRQSRRSAQSKKRMGAFNRSKNAPLASVAAAAAAAATGIAEQHRVTMMMGNAFDEAPAELWEEEEGNLEREEDEDEEGVEESGVDLSDRVEGDAPLEEESAAAAAAAAASAAASGAAAAGEAVSAGLPTSAELMEEPNQVQLLLSHPTSRGFFRRTALLVVRHVTHESAAFVLNKPLRNDEGVEMSIEATVRLGRVHPIFRRHLTQHTLMIGGPVMSGSSFDESIFLLHRVRGIPNALPLGSGLYMDGDLDALMAKLDAGEASAEADVVVLCGFAGWGVDQLKGELSNGYWVVASGASEEPAVGSFVMSLAQGTTGRAAPLDIAPAAPSPATTGENAAPAAATATVDAPAEAGTAAAGEAEAVSSDAVSIVAQAQRAADAAAARAIPALKHRSRRAEKAGKGAKGGRVETLSWVRAFAALGAPYAEMAMNQKAYAKDEDFQE